MIETMEYRLGSIAHVRTAAYDVKVFGNVLIYLSICGSDMGGGCFSN